jgi:hypothetical protein
MVDQMFEVWSTGDTSNDYVEITVSNNVAVKVNGISAVGVSVVANVFSHDAKYDGLVEFDKKLFASHEEGAALRFADKLAQEYGLERDLGCMHRRKVWTA